MWKLLQKINKNLITAIPVLMVTGFVTGIFINAAPLKQLIVPFTFSDGLPHDGHLENQEGDRGR